MICCGPAVWQDSVGTGTPSVLVTRVDGLRAVTVGLGNFLAVGVRVHDKYGN